MASVSGGSHRPLLSSRESAARYKPSGVLYRGMTNPFDVALQFGPHYGQMTWGWMGWGGILAMVVFALLLAAVVLAVVRLVFVPVVESTEPAAARRPAADAALTELRNRFARGEIEEEEFERRRSVLEESRA